MENAMPETMSYDVHHADGFSLSDRHRNAVASDQLPQISPYLDLVNQKIISGILIKS
jgi:hypothetical protein